jgi:hypothetical protein
VEKITLRSLSDQPIGMLVRPAQLYKGFIFPHEEKKNFGSWFTKTKKIKCMYQAYRDANNFYQMFLNNQEKNIIEQFQELKFGNLGTLQETPIQNDCYVGVVTSFVYYHNRSYHICDSIEKQQKLLSKKSKYKDVYIILLGIRLYHGVDLNQQIGITEWKYHALEGFDLLYPSHLVITLQHLINFESIKLENNIVTSRKEYVVIDIAETDPPKNIAASSLTNKEIKILTDVKTRYFEPNVSFKLQ